VSTRAALVTGGASGIGRATVERLLADGWRVVLADLNAGTGQRAAAELGGPDAGDSVRFVRADVSEESDVSAAVAACVEAFGRIDCVVNNAGVGGAFGALTDIEVGSGPAGLLGGSPPTSRPGRPADVIVPVGPRTSPSRSARRRSRPSCTSTAVAG
jgi:NAD(P)-dependent dehydrogenase (short-subunit alcohol dehydrogenase family)